MRAVPRDQGASLSSWPCTHPRARLSYNKRPCYPRLNLPATISSPQSVLWAGMGQVARGLVSVNTSVPATLRLATAASPKVHGLLEPLGQVWGRQALPNPASSVWYLTVKQCLRPTEATPRAGEMAFFTRYVFQQRQSPLTPSMRLDICPGTGQARRLQVSLYFVSSGTVTGETGIQECE